MGSAKRDPAVPRPWLPGQWHLSAEMRGAGDNSTMAARPGYQPAGQTVVTVPVRPAVVLGGPAGSPCACRVEEPDRLLRVWGMLSASSGELRIEYASLVGWASGLVIAMLDQLHGGNTGITEHDGTAGLLRRTPPWLGSLSDRTAMQP